MRTLAAALLLMILPPQESEQRLKAGDAHLERGDFRSADAEFTRALELNPALVEAWVGRAKARFKRNDLPAAIRDLNRAVALDARSMDALFWRGICRQERGDPRGALEDYDQVVLLGAKTPQVFHTRGVCHAALEQWERALEDFDRTMSLGLRSSKVYLDRGWCRFQLLDMKGAISDATRALQQTPKVSSAWRNRAMAYGALESWENALRDYERATELEGRQLPEGAIWAWTVRSRLGRREEADRNLRQFRAEAPESAQGKWSVRLMDYVLGDLKEEALLEDLSKAEPEARAGRTADAHFLIGIRRLLQGDAPAAAGAFERSARVEGGAAAGVLSRWEVEKSRLERHKGILDGLEKSFRTLRPFRAEFACTGMDDPKEQSIRKFALTADLAAGRIRGEFQGRDHQKDRDLDITIDFENLTSRIWGHGDRPVVVDMEPFFQGMSGWAKELAAEAGRLLPPEAAREKAPAFGDGWHLLVTLDGKPSADRQGNLRCALGRATSPSASWIREPRLSLGVVCREEEDRVVFDLPSRKKRIVVDRKTGFLLSIRSEDFDGKIREIVRTSFRQLEAFPESKRPEKFDRAPLDFSGLVALWQEQAYWVSDLLAGALDHWETVRVRDPEVAAMVTRWAARYSDSIRTFALKSLARTYVRRELDRGVPLADLLKEGESERFAQFVATQKEEIDRFLKSRLEEAAFKIETDLIETPVDNRLHDVAAELLQRSTRPATVEAERARTYGEPLEKLFKEELEAQRQL